ncbi:hypothetical protein [Radiobacillus sp. PE A8.2]|uniref:hypothetical protein n=1 Tax=Radiobacillus sp. PE A8.2 TaxID=3380349 RepID=UPI00388D0B9C
MLLTPIGPIKLFVNNDEINFKATKVSLDKRCSDVNGRYLIEYKFSNNSKVQKIRCCLPSIDIEGDIESGERFETIAFYKNSTKLTIGAEASFGLETEYGYDYTGNYLSNGIQCETNSSTKNQIFHFGASWIQPFTEDNDHQTWYGADPTLMGVSKER